MLGLLLAAAAAATPYAFGAESRVDYHLVHPLHQVTGTTHALRGTIALADERLVTPVTLRVPLTAFDSGNANRDANALATLEAGRFPAATFEVTRFAERSRTRAGSGLDLAGDAAGTLTLHGVARAIAVPLRVHVAPEAVTVDGSFEVKLSDYQIPRPSLLFKPVEDAVRVDVHGVAPRSLPR